MPHHTRRNTGHLESLKTGYNLNKIGTSFLYSSSIPIPDEVAIMRHKLTLLHAMSRNLSTKDCDYILNKYRRSPSDQEALLTDFFKGDTPYHTVVKDDHYYRALETTLNAFRPPQPMKPVHLLDIEQHYPFNLDVNAELPFSQSKEFRSEILTAAKSDPTINTSKLTKFSTYKPLIFSYARRWHHEIKERLIPHVFNPHDLPKRHIYPMLLHMKPALVPKDEPDKVRAVWGVPKPYVLAEIIFWWRYFAWAKEHPGATPLLWGYETYTGGWFRLNAELFHRHMFHSFIMIDWTRFDKFARFTILRDLFHGRRSYLDLRHGYVPQLSDYTDTTPSDPDRQEIRLTRLLDWTEECFFRTPIILPNGDMYQRIHSGIPSGIYTTQFTDSQYNMHNLLTILYSLGVEPVSTKILGDDSLIKTWVLIPPNEHTAFLDKMQTKANYYTGSIISIEKSKMTNGIQHATVLGYDNHYGYPWRDSIKLFAQFYHTKAARPTPETTMAASLGVATATLGNHRRVYSTCKDIYEYYASQGYTPDVRGMKWIFPDPAQSRAIDVSHFPTLSEIRRFQLTSDYHSQAASKFWPRTFFAEEP